MPPSPCCLRRPLIGFAASASAQGADPTPPWRYDPVGVGNARSYAQEVSSTPYWRTDSPAALALDGHRWTVRRTQWFSRLDGGGWSRTEARVLVRYDTSAANVLTRSEGGQTEPLYPCRLDVPLTTPEGGTCGEGVRYVKAGDGRLSFPGSGNGFATVLEAGVGVVRESTDRQPDSELVGAVVDGDTLLAEPDAFPDSRLDPTPAARYAPMSVGDEWQYEYRDGSTNGGFPVYRRVQVLSEREIDGHLYFGSSSGSYMQDQGDWVYTGETTYARFDTLSARVVSPDGYSDFNGYYGLSCPLDEPASGFGDSVYCSTYDVSGTELGESIAIQGAGTLMVGADAFDTSTRGHLYTGLADYYCDQPSYAAGVGYVGYECFNLPFVYYRLTYARVRQPDGSILELGRPYAVAVADAPEPGRLALTVGPSPTAGPVTLRLAVPADGPVRWEAFDALGRRVWQRAETLAAGDAARPAGRVGLAPRPLRRPRDDRQRGGGRDRRAEVAEYTQTGKATSATF